MPFEYAFTMDTSSIKFGVGATREVGYDMRQLGARRVMVLTDPRLAHSAPVETVMESLRHHGIDAVLYDQVQVEPTDQSFKDASRFASEGKFDGFVAVGGGSTMDTAKAANLYATYPADFLDYVNPPIGKGKPVPGPLKPLIAIPTTAGTGSETTGVAIFDFVEMGAKTGIRHRALRPTMGILDPENTRTMPPMVAACTGLDVLSHAIESFTALPYHRREASPEPGLRPAYQGSNPISDIWAAEAIRRVAMYLVREVEDPEDEEARSQMLLAASMAGVGFGNAGVHLPHGMSYAVSGLVRTYRAEGYPADHPLIPHGMSVILNAPAVFRWTAQAAPERHLKAAELLGADVRGAGPEDAGEILANALIALMRRLNIPNGLSGVGYSEADLDALVAGTLPQKAVIGLSPRPVTAEDLRELFRSALRYW